MVITAAQLQVDVTANTKDAERDVAGFGERLESLGKSFSSAGKNLSLGLTAPIVGFGTAVLMTSANFEAGMNRVAAVSGATAAQLDEMTKTARDLGRSTQYSATQAADAMGFLAMAGFQTNEIVGAMPGVLQLAAAGQLDLARAADITSNILTGYGMQVEDLGRVNDVLAKAFTSANVDLEMLGVSMKYVGPVASGLGVAFEETAAAIALMGNAGIQGSMAGTALRGALSRLVNPTAANARLIEQLGLNVFNAEGQFVGLTSVIEQLEGVGADTAVMMELFGDRAGPAMAALVEQGSGALRNMVGELENAGGTAERIATTQMKGLRGAFITLKSATEDLFISFGEIIVPLFERLAVVLTRLANVMSGLSPQMRRFAAVFAGILAVIGPFLLAIGKAIAIVTFFASPIGILVGLLFALAGAVAGAAAWWDGFGKVLARGQRRLQAAVGIIRDAFITLRMALRGDWLDNRRILGVHRAFGMLGMTFNFLQNALRDVSRIGRVASGTFLGFPPALRPVLQVLGFLINAGAALVRVWRNDIIPTVATVARTVGGVLVAALSTAYTAVTRLIRAFREGGFVGAVREIGSMFRDVDWSGIGQALLSELGGAVARLSELAWDAGAWLMGRIRAVNWNSVASSLMAFLGDALGRVAGAAWDAAGWFTGLLGEIQWGDIASTMLGKLRDAFDAVTDLAWDAAVWVAGLIADVRWLDVATTILTGIRDAFLAVAGLAWDAAKWVADLISDVKWGNLARRILVNIRNGFNAVKNLTWDAGKWVANLISGVDWATVGQTILDKIVVALTAIKAVVWDVAAWVKEQVEGTNWQEVASTIVDKIADGIRTVKGIGEAVADAITAHNYAPAGRKIGEDLSTGVNEGLAEGERGGPSIWDRVISGLGPIGPMLDTAMRNIAQGVRDILTAGGNLASAMGTFVSAFDGFARAGARLLPIIKAVAGALAFIGSTAVTGAMWLFGEFLSAAALRMNMFARTLEQAAIPIRIFGSLLDVSLGVAIEVITEFIRVVHGGWSTSMEILGTAAEIGVTLVSKAFGGLSTILSTLGGWVTAVLSKAGEVASGFITAITTLPSDVLGFFQTLYDNATGKLGELVTAAGTKAGEIVSGLITGVTPVVEQARTIFNDVSEAILSPIRSLITLIFAYGSDVLNGFLAGINSVWESLTSTAASIKDTVLGAITGLYDSARQAGKDFLQGLWDGLTDNALISGITGAVGFLGSLLGGLDVPDRSPVDHAGREIGAEFAENIAKGIRSQYRAINLAVDGIGRNLAATNLPTLTAGAAVGASVAGAGLAARGGNVSNTYSLVVNIDGSQDVTAVKRVVEQAFHEVFTGTRAAGVNLPGNP